MEIKTVGVACDHAGYPLKKFVLQYLEEQLLSTTQTSVMLWPRALRVARFILVLASVALARV